MLQIAGLLFANPSNPASAGLCLIFHRRFWGSKTGRCVSHCPVAGRAVTHSVTWRLTGNSGNGLTEQFDNYWLRVLCYIKELHLCMTNRFRWQASSHKDLRCSRNLQHTKKRELRCDDSTCQRRGQH